MKALHKYAFLLFLISIGLDVSAQGLSISRPTKRVTRQDMESFFEFQTRTNVKKGRSKGGSLSISKPNRGGNASGNLSISKPNRGGASTGNLSLSQPNRGGGSSGNLGISKPSRGSNPSGDFFKKDRRKRRIRRNPEMGLIPKKRHWRKGRKKRDKKVEFKRKGGKESRDSQ